MMTRRRRPRGYVLLVALLVVLALGLLAAMSLRQSGNERRAATLERDRAQALALAEAGLERASAMLTTMLDNDAVDLDLALDPGGDTTCTSTPPTLTLGGPQGDDGVPPWGDGVVVTAGPRALNWRQVAVGDGSYLVRIDDNADDADPALPASVTGNTGACVEGGAFVHGQNPVRDRDRRVVVTAVGVFPGTDATRARATRALRATFGPPPPAGIIANGDVDLHGAAHVCGPYGAIGTTGSVLDSCLCGVACPGHLACAADQVCDARAAGPTCNTSAAGGGGACLANQRVPAVPRVSPWDVRNAPPRCTAPPCTPFFYLRWDGAETKVYAWDYAATPTDVSVAPDCSNPGAWARLCHPGDTDATCDGHACWTPMYQATNSGGVATDVRLPDGPGYTVLSPPAIAPAGINPLVWKTNVNADGAGEHAPGCGTVVNPPYPWPAGGVLDWDSSPSHEFEVRADGALGQRLPRGVWMVEGNVKWAKDAQPCGAVPVGWKLSLLVLGDAVFDEDAFFLPASRRAVAVVAGRDLVLRTGNTDVRACGPGAFLAHEQFTMGANMTLSGQLVVENVGTCSDEAAGAAVDVSGNGTILEPDPPPIPFGTALQRRTWAESAW